MAYSYCTTCDTEMSEPTIEELLEEDWCCHEGHQNDLLEDPDKAMIRILLERIENLEARLGNNHAKV